MKTKRLYVILVAILGIFLCVNAQQDSTFTKIKKDKTFFQKSLLPASLILGGTLISGSGFEKSVQKDIRNTVGNNFYFGIDDYTRYVPIIEMYIADAFGVKAKNH